MRIQPKNLLVEPNGRVLAIIDWELARRSHPLNDLALLLRFASAHDAETEVIAAYAGALGLRANDVRRAAKCYDLIKVTVGLGEPGSDTPDIPAWLDYVDGCLIYLRDGDGGRAWSAAERLIEF